jgi:hypothetical protein
MHQPNLRSRRSDSPSELNGSLVADDSCDGQFGMRWQFATHGGFQLHFLIFYISLKIADFSQYSSVQKYEINI